MWFCRDLIGFYSDLWGLYGDFMGFYGQFFSVVLQEFHGKKSWDFPGDFTSQFMVEHGIQGD